MALRDGRWKLLASADGSQAELYDFEESDKEIDNVAERYPEVVRRLQRALHAFRDKIPASPRTN